MLPYPPHPCNLPPGVLPSTRLMGMYRWMGSHFHGWIENNGVAFSLELLEWDRTFPGFGGSGRSGFKNWEDFYSIKFNQCVNSFHGDLVKRPLQGRWVNSKLLSWDREKYIFPKVTEKGSLFGHRIDHNMVGVWEASGTYPVKINQSNLPGQPSSVQSDN